MTAASMGGPLPTGGGETDVAPSMPATANAATCSRCGHEKAEHGNDVLPFAPCQHREGRPATARLFPFAYATESCWCSNYEEAENHV